jgi:hypothetical protein
MTAASDFREAISAAVRRVDVVQINPSVARRLVEWLGELAEIRRRTNGCPPIGLVEVQQALAEAVAGGGDSRQREPEGLAAAEILGLNRDTEITTAEARCPAWDSGRLGALALSARQSR